MKCSRHATTITRLYCKYKHFVIVAKLWKKTTISLTHPNDMCVSCVAGKYSDTVGAKSCKDCQRGKYSGTTRAKSCQDCQTGKSHKKIGISNSYLCKTFECN